jgi:CheY-like chemotaxis protein
MSARILIGADDSVRRRLLKTLVHQFGYQAETVESGEAVLARLQSPGAPAVGLANLDLVMPDLGGTTGLARLWEAGKTLPIIFETSRTVRAVPAVRATTRPMPPPKTRVFARGSPGSTAEGAEKIPNELRATDIALCEAMAGSAFARKTR